MYLCFFISQPQQHKRRHKNTLKADEKEAAKTIYVIGHPNAGFLNPFKTAETYMSHRTANAVLKGLRGHLVLPKGTRHLPGGYEQKPIFSLYQSFKTKMKKSETVSK